MTIDELEVLITAKTDKLQKEINKANASISSLSKNAEKQSGLFTNAFSKLKTGIKALAIGVLIKKVIIDNLDDAIDRLDTLNNFTKVMSNLGISSEDSQSALNRLSEGLKGLPTTLDDAALAVQRFTSSNGNVKASTEIFLALNNAILAGGASAQIQSSALEQLSQAYAKGKPDMMEWRTAMTAMPAQLKQIAVAMGYVDANQLGEALRSGKVSMNEFMLKIAELNKNGVNGFKSFEEQAKNATGGVRTSITGVKTALTRGLTEIMNAIGQSNIAGFFQGIARAIDAVIPYIVAFVKVIVTAINAVSSLFGKKSEASGGSLADNTATASSNVGSMSKSMDSANKSAKQMKQTLAGFDEISNLNFDSGSGDDSESAGEGNYDFSGMDFSAFDSNEAVSKADEIANKIKSKIKEIGGILNKELDLSGKFERVKGILTNFWNNISELGTPLKSWFDNDYTEYLKQRVETDLLIVSGLFDDIIMVSDTFLNTFLAPFLSTLVNYILPVVTQLATQIYKTIGVLFTTINGLFQSLWKTGVEPAITLIMKIWDDLWNSVSNAWQKWGEPIFESINEFIVVTGDLLQSLWDNFFQPIWDNIVKALDWLWSDHVKPLWDNLLDFFGELVKGILDIWNKTLAPLLTWIVDTFGPVLSDCINVITNVIATVLGVVTDVINGIITILKGIVQFIVGVFTGNWEKAWEGISNIFKGIWDGIVGIVKGAINLVIDFINGMIAAVENALNWIIDKINSLEIRNPFTGEEIWSPNIPRFKFDRIPKLARGGIVDKPTQTIIGEAGTEAVIPLEHNTSWMDAMASKFAVMFNEMREDQEININNKLSINGRDLATTTIEDYNNEAIRRGYKPLLQPA